jgi:DNA-binding NarL/FixJ family response regulator
MRILIADDHEVIRRGVIRVLQSRDDVEECAEATNGQEAIEKTLEWKPDLILLDVRLPLLDGFAVAREIKQYEPDIAILFFSIYDTEEILEEAKSVGHGFVLKEKIAEMLPKAVEALLHKQTFFPPVDRDYQNLVLRFQEVKEAYAQAKTPEEKADLLKVARGILREAQEQVAQIQNEIDRMRKS